MYPIYLHVGCKPGRQRSVHRRRAAIDAAAVQVQIARAGAVARAVLAAHRVVPGALVATQAQFADWNCTNREDRAGRRRSAGTRSENVLNIWNTIIALAELGLCSLPR